MKRSTLIKSSFWTVCGVIANRILTLFSNLLLARLLTPSEFGVISIAYIFWAFANLFSQDAVGSFIACKNTEDKRYINTTYTISILTGIAAGLLLVCLSPFAAKLFNVPNLVWILLGFAFNIVLSSAQSVYAWILTKRMQHQQLAMAMLMASIGRVVTTISCALSGLSYWSFLAGDTISSIIALVLTHHFVKDKLSFQIDPEVKSEVLSYSLAAMGFSFGFYINANSDNFIIGKLLGSTSLGYYNFGYQLTTTLTTVLNQAITQVGMTAFAKLSDDKQQEFALTELVEQLTFLAAPIYALFYLIIDRQTISLIFGSKWEPTSTVIPWLLIFSYFRLINGCLSSMLFAKGRPGINAKINILIAPLGVVSFIYSANAYGIVGVSIAVALVLGIIWTVYWWLVGCRALGWPAIKFLKPSFQAALTAIFAISVSLFAPRVIRPFLFVGVYLLLLRITASSQFFNYLSMVRKGNRERGMGKGE